MAPSAALHHDSVPDGDDTDSPIARYVRALGGKRPIRKVLIANNGIAAVKAIRSIRRWSYETFGDEHTVEFVAMATPEDVAANAEYVRMADIWTSVPGGSNNHNFANVDLIADRADRYRCQAVWAGWGHASENPMLPAKLAKLGITFLGPNPKSMHALGDKIASTIIAQSADVPTVAWSGQGLSVDYKLNGCVPADTYQRACVVSAGHAERVAKDCGYPIVVKASEGGGGKGIRVVFEEGAICSAYRQVVSEVPGSPIFLMALVQNARHLEVQIVADEHGDAIALYGRDCSVQRRHQKIIEEGPVVAAPPHVWKKLEQAAIALAKEVGYVGAGTVEYLYKGDNSDGEFFFLELNPRLQVEHPVTEWITGVNLPALQLHIGMGIPLRNVSTIRKFYALPEITLPNELLAAPAAYSSGLTTPPSLPRPVVPMPSDCPAKAQRADDASTGSEELINLTPVPPHGHVIACRVTAENPDEGFQPTSGAIQELTFRNTPNVWGYFSVGASGGVHEFADSQFGHLFAWGETRESSRRSLVLALKELSIRGDIRTTVEYIVKLLEMKAFRENKIDTAWLDTLIADKVVAEKPPTDLAVVVGAVCRAHIDFTERADAFTKCLERGQLPPLDRTLVHFPVELIYDDVKYCFDVSRADVCAFRVRLSGTGSGAEEATERDGEHSVLVELRTLADGAKLVLANGRSHVCYLREEPAGLRLSIDGKTCLFPKEYDPTVLASAVSGKLVRYLVENDAHVNVGQAYAELEVMKMYLTLSAPESGRITLTKSEASAVEVGDVIAHLELDDPTKVRRAEKFTGKLPTFGPPQTLGSKPHQLFNAARKSVELLIRGFDADPNSLETFMNCIDDPRVAAGEIREALSALSGRIRPDVTTAVDDTVDKMLLEAGFGLEGSSCAGAEGIGLQNEDNGNGDWEHRVTIIAKAVAHILTVIQEIPEAADLIETVSTYSKGSVLASSVASLLDAYLSVERPFARSATGAADALFELRDANRNDLSSLVEVAASHICLLQKNDVVVSFLEALTRPALAAVLAEDNAETADFKAHLHQLSQLYAPAYSDIALRARLILADFRRPHFHQRKGIVARMLYDAAKAPENERALAIQNIVGLNESILDVLVTFVLPSDASTVPPAVRRIAVEVQLRRSYRAYEVSDMAVKLEDGSTTTLTAKWCFQFSKRGISASFSTGATAGSTTSDQEKSQLERGITSFDSADNLSQAPGDASNVLDSEPLRRGFLATFSSWEDMERQFDAVLEQGMSADDVTAGRDVNIMTVLLRWDAAARRRSASQPTSPLSPLENGVSTSFSDLATDSVRDPVASEAIVSDALSAFCCAKGSRLVLARQAGLKSITFIIAPPQAGESVTYPGFYTFRVRDSFREDPIFRHIDPPMAFQLELARLSNFSITRFGYPTRSIHVFFAQDKSAVRRKRSSTTSPVLKSRPPLSDGSLHESTSPIDPATSGDVTRSTEPGAAEVLNSMNLGDAIHNKVEAAASRGHASSAKASTRPERDVDARFFVRAVVRHADVFSASNDDAVVSIPEAERTFVEALDAVEMASCDRRFRRTDFNHIFLNIIPPVHIDIDDVETICRRMFQRYAARCWSLRVFVVEIKIPALVSNGDNPMSTIPLRFLLFNPTGHMLRVESYIESTDPNTGVERVISVSQDNHGSLHGTAVSKPYPVMDRIQRKRVVAQTIETTYVYDFLQIFTKQLQRQWRLYSEDRLLGGFRRHKIPVTLIESTELVLGVDRKLVETQRQAGLNDIGMVAWRCTLRTPEYPSGRETIIIANDITFRSGSFGPDEDALFLEASSLARAEGIPRIYLAANSGARIGVAEEVRDRIQVNWVDPCVPTKGIRSLVISEKDLAEVPNSVVTGRRIGESLLEVTDILGAENGLGVENLMGSGLIAGETSRAYDETFTITYVTARSVGIGAYLVRLGQRVIQKESAAPIILTGYSALNKVLGHEVYMSNEQLGGTKVMFPNGVTHSVVADDVEGVGAILEWISFVPRTKGDLLPIIESRDAVARQIAVVPPLGGQPYDPRVKLLCGEPSGKDFLGGLFDKDSWREYLEGWAKTVVVGRARLGGIPTGVIAVETRSVERTTPADPASPETHESVVTQAGQVWYPDSAAKTAQSIKDFDREGLPLFILANWRGFSGGMRDMFDEVLKAGSEIVDALRSYKQPVFVYIPPGAELRGGAWVVVDTLINPECIEMYADPGARGGVLEPEGTVDVKYRRRNIIHTMHRLDATLIRLNSELASGGKQSRAMLSDEYKRSVHDAIYAREVEILPSYRNVATAFCDLHDTPGRLLAKGAIRKIVNWREARSFFYWRLQRRIAEDRVRNLCLKADPSLSTQKVTAYLRKWAADYRAESGISAVGGSFDDDDRWLFQWLEVEEDVIARKIDKIRIARIGTQVSELCTESVEGFLDGIEAALRGCADDNSRSKLLAAMREKMNRASSAAGSSTRGILSRLGQLGWDNAIRR